MTIIYMIGIATGKIKPIGQLWVFALLDLAVFVAASIAIPG